MLDLYTEKHRSDSLDVSIDGEGNPLFLNSLDVFG